MPNTALVNEALQRFDDNHRRISNAITNYNKLGRANQSRAVTEGRLRLLDKYWTDVQQASTQVELYATQDDREVLDYFTSSLLEKAEDSYVAAYDFFQEKLTSFVPAGENNGSTRTSAAGPAAAADHVASEFKLPTISVPTFSGNLTDWIAFRDLFTSLVTSRVGLSNVQKLHYLLSVVTDDAAKLIAHISLSDANFTVAWRILKEEHYENERSIINAHLTNFFAMKTVTPSDAVNGLKRLRASSSESVNALKALQRPVDGWNDILVFSLVQKFDKYTRREWEVHLGDGSDYPKMERLTKFLDTRIRSLEAAASIQPTEKAPESSGKKENKANPKPLRSHHGTATDSCVFCSDSHKIAQCEKFKSKSVAERQKFARQNYLCINCLSKGHITTDCRSSFNCFHCKRRHHSLLHEHRTDRGPANTLAASAPNPSPASTRSSASDNRSTTSEQSDSNITHAHVATQATAPKETVLLATAWVHLESDQGRQIQARALIDPGSDASFVSENLVQCLRLFRETTNAYVASIGGHSVSTVKATVPLTISPIQDPTRNKLQLQALVLPKITSYVPSKVPFDMALAEGLVLADPEPMSSAPIELLLGADLYADIVLEGIRKEASHKLLFQNTVFGWIISGALSDSKSTQRTIHAHHASAQDVTSDLLKFFETEEVPIRKYFTPAENQCETHFRNTHYRTPEDKNVRERKYVVRLPFKTNTPIAIGDTKARALASVRHLEKRLQRDTELCKQYSAFLCEYEESGHMEPFDGNSERTQTVFLPHHPVIKDSTTTKVRVVFNASASSSNGSSLNDHLWPGPNLQPDLVSVILNWRMFRYVFTADIAQMFRQILVDARDRSYQLILWRPSPAEEIRPYVLTTVTYGTASAPFLAQRVLLQVAEDEGPKFPLAVPILKRQRYMDDLMFGDDSKEKAVQKRNQITECLARAGFTLRKWASNDPALLAGIESTNHGLALSLPLEEGSKLKVLGLIWEPISDSFHIVAQLPTTTLPTKRQILSLVARCFDPLGWLAPVVVGPKILVQRLWSLKLGWDDPIPESMAIDWHLFCNQLPKLSKIAIPRWTASDSSTSVQVHGFCDASERAYAAVTYLLVRSGQTEAKASLMFAKTRVAPLKTLTIPRLELCAAVLLARCISVLLESISIPIESITCWSDSTVVLCWLKKSPSNLKAFTAHRVAEIQTQLPRANWKHVSSEENPADCASRGLSPSQLKDHPLWWHGPQWLTSEPNSWPDQTFLEFVTTEVDSKIETHAHLQTRDQDKEKDCIEQLSRDISTWPRLVRVTAYLLRFITRTRNPVSSYPDLALKVEEVRTAENWWLRRAQRETFPSELDACARGLPVPVKSKLKTLDPYVDETGLLRIGGRLQQSDLSTGRKHPVILSNHRITSMLATHVHRVTLHGGVQLMLRVLREEYWVLRARNLVRSVLHSCVRCTRERAETRTQFMASLPRTRIVRSRPFSHSGVDYTGPFLVRNAAGRGRTSHKAYIALFVCLATRAIHLELVHDYSSAAFLAAFQRFSSRRGLPSNMYSDNGTTFQGTERELREAFQQILKEVDFRNIFASDQVSWKFLPPAAPHFGGLWEAGVKSVKHHLKRILQSSTPTIEEFETLLCNIEACLNSRPIAALSDDPSSYDALTPGHFLIGSSLKSVPLPSTLDLKENRLDRWQAMQHKYEQFWQIWSLDYVNSLQQRMKWQTRQPNIEVGDLVLLRNENLPPSKWNLARVTECFTDRENLVRSVRVRTANSEYIRPIVKLCKLPVQMEAEAQTLESTAGD